MVFKIGRELISSNIALGTDIGKVRSRGCDAHVACKAAAAQLAKVSKNADKIAGYEKDRRRSMCLCKSRARN